MRSDTLYEERIFSRWPALIFGFSTIALLTVFLCLLFINTSVKLHATAWSFFFLFLLSLAFTINFSILTIKITLSGISASYGIIRHNIPWNNVVDCHSDSTREIHGGFWNIFPCFTNDKKQVVYNAKGVPGVVIQQDDIPALIFSTRNPDQVIKIIKHEFERK